MLTKLVTSLLNRKIDSDVLSSSSGSVERTKTPCAFLAVTRPLTSSILVPLSGERKVSPLISAIVTAEARPAAATRGRTLRSMRGSSNSDQLNDC